MFDTRRNVMFQNTFGGKQDIVDVVVVGACAAGLSAALYLSRARRRTVVYDGGPTRNSTTEQVHELLGHEGNTPADLQARGRAGVASYGGEIRSEAVLKIEPRSHWLFEVWGRPGLGSAPAALLPPRPVPHLPLVPRLPL